MRNFFVMIGVITISFAYLRFISTFLPEEYALVSNFILIPAVLGLLAGFMLVGRLPIKLALLALIPLAHVLVFGQDAGKPGLENILAISELIALCIGCVFAHLLVQKKAESAVPQLRQDKR